LEKTLGVIMNKKQIFLTVSIGTTIALIASTFFYKKTQYPDTVTGQIVTLKKLTLDSAVDYYKLLSKELSEFLELPENISQNYINQHIQIKFDKMQKNLKIAYNIWDNRDNRMVGATEIRKKDPDDPGQFEIWINENYHGGGRAQEAMYLISKAYFEANPTIKSYNAYVRPWNPRSLRALEKFGFKKSYDRVENGKTTDYVLELDRKTIENKTKQTGETL